MRDKLVTISKGDVETQVVETSFERIWKDKGWKLVKDKGDAKPAANAKTAADSK
jgi:hypothetical protein